MDFSNHTVDTKDINHFNRLAKANQWWSDLCLLITMNQVRVPFILTAAKECGLTQNNCLKGLKVLDVGCGGGILSEEMAKLGADVIGLDAGHEVINLAKIHAMNNIQIDNNKITYICSTIEDFCNKHQNRFDIVIASEILEHVLNPGLFLQCCIETLKPNCPIIITTINRTWYSRMKAIIFYEYILNLIPKGTHDWNKFITPKELREMFQNCNCESKSVEGIEYDRRQTKWKITNNPSNFYMSYAIKNKSK